MTRTEILKDFAAAREEVTAYFAGLLLEEAYSHPEGAWAPIDDLRHLTLSIAAVTRGFEAPPPALRERFGVRDAPYRSRTELAAIAREGLRQGGRATPSLSPEPIPEGSRTEAFRAECVRGWRDACVAFEAALERWSEDDLDRHQFPHPFLGDLSLREWADFNVLHARHHVGVAERRLGRG